MVGNGAALGRYGTRDMARLLELPEGRVRGYVKMGLVEPLRGPRGALQFSFQDLILLRAAKSLLDAKISSRRVRQALRKLRAQLPADRPLTGVHIQAEASRIVVRDGEGAWHPESGQALLDLSISDLARRAAPLASLSDRQARLRNGAAKDWYARGCALEEADPTLALEAYRKALELDPRHGDANLNLGRLLHESGDLRGAESHYRQALEAQPDDATAAFNLGVALEDQGKHPAAVQAYEQALAIDPGFADAHYNLAHVHEQLGHRAAALRHLHAYRKLRDQRS